VQSELRRVGCLSAAADGRLEHDVATVADAVSPYAKTDVDTKRTSTDALERLTNRARHLVSALLGWRDAPRSMSTASSNHLAKAPFLTTTPVEKRSRRKPSPSATATAGSGALSSASQNKQLFRRFTQRRGPAAYRPKREGLALIRAIMS